jgi:ketosteroid isomerase-like protein
VITYPFAPPGMPRELRGRDAIRGFYATAASARELIEIEGTDAVVHETSDPEVVITEITHHGWSRAAAEPYRFTALGVIRVRDGQIVHYDDYMDPIALARMLGRTGDLAAALSAAAPAAGGDATEG